MGLARESVVVPLAPERAAALWTDVRRWPTFVEGFGHALALDPSWPAAGAKPVWESRPGGRGRVTERVLEYEPGRRIETEVLEEALSGRQTVSFEPAEGPPAGGGGAATDPTRVELELDYELQRFGALRPIADVLFIRRALSDSLARTLRRFATEAVEESAL